MTPPIALSEAQQQLLNLATPLGSETVAIHSALGRYLRKPVVARRTQPPADLSSMDGYATSGDGPWSLIGESRGGNPFPGQLDAGQAIRISTGAVMPDGADTVLIQEHAKIDGNQLNQTAQSSGRTYVRSKGFDFAATEHVLGAGDQIGPAQVALALSAGCSTVTAHRLPKLALIEGGDELVSDPALADTHHIPATNNAMLAAMTHGMTCDTRMIGPVTDSLDALTSAFKSAGDTDIIVTSGGASVGDHDLVLPALESLGAEITFWRVALKPGKPLLVAKLGHQVVLGLPGNPVSSFTTAFLFLLPLLRHMAGAPFAFPRSTTAQLSQPLPANGSRRQFLRAVWDGTHVAAVDEQDSSALRALATANAFIERPENCAGTEAGTFVPIYPLQNGGIA